MGIVSRGFRGRRRPSAELPPGQYLAEDFPVLSAGPTPSIELGDWAFTITNEGGDQQRWDAWATTTTATLARAAVLGRLRRRRR
jgi:hypothetical protein